MKEQASVAAIILAAGTSSRMRDGQQKLLLPLANRPVVVHTIEAVLASHTHPIIIVLGHQAQHVRAQIEMYLKDPQDPRLIFVENAVYAQGMSTSLREGLQTLLTEKMQTEPIRGAIILLGDQPFITSEIINAIIEAHLHSNKQIIAPLYRGKRGNPVLFDAGLFAELMQVTGDEGGRSVIERHQQELLTIELENTLANIDVDTWEAYQEVVGRWRQTT